jgi:hypothetical protein
VVTSKKSRRKKNIITATITQRNERAMAMPIQNANLPRPNGTRREGRKAQAQGQIAATKMLPRTPRASAVTVTLSEAAKTSYVEVLARARNHISLKELGVERIEMRKTATEAIVIGVPGDRERDNAAKLAIKLASVLDPAAVKVAAPLGRAELKIERIEVSVNKEELRHALAIAVGCKVEEVRVGEIGLARGGLGTAWVRCPVAGAKKL